MDCKSFNKESLKGIDDKLAAGVEPAVFHEEEAMEKIQQMKKEAMNNRIPAAANVQAPAQEPVGDGGKIIDEMNQEYAVVQMGNQVLILQEKKYKGTLSISYLNLDSFKLKKANRKFVVKNDQNSHTVKAADYWLEHERRRDYDGIVFEPGNQDPRFYNLWKGFAVEVREGDCSLYLHHVRDPICSGNAEYYDYLMAWMAHAIQKPSERPETAIVLRGKQGTGKGVFVKFFGELFGDHYLQITHSRYLVGNFNAHLQNKIVLFADEAFWAGDKQGENVLKGLITEPYNVIEMKHRDPIRIPNLIRLIMASNEDWVIPANVDDRRYMVLDVSERRQQDHNYFSQIQNQMDNGGREALLHYLMQYDLSEVDLRTIPQTEALLQQKLLSLNPVNKFWYERLQAGTVLADDDSWKSQIPISQFYSEYCDFAKKIGYKRICPVSEFGVEFHKACPQLDKKRMKTANVKRSFHYIVPSLKECRIMFETFIGNKIQWNYIDDEWEEDDDSCYSDFISRKESMNLSSNEEKDNRRDILFRRS